MQRLWSIARRFGFVAVIAIAGVECGGQLWIRAREVPADDWLQALSVVRRQRREGDLIVAAPAWTDPILRQHAGDLLDAAQAGRSDLAPFERVWSLSIRGARPPELAGRPASERWTFGGIALERWDLGPSTVQLDLVEELPRAAVSYLGRPCPWRRSRPAGGGIYEGPVAPAERFICDPAPWRWVGATVMPDRSLAARRCIWAHPSGPEPVRITYSDVPLGDRIVFYGGLSYAQAREPVAGGGPVDVVVRINGEVVGRRTHQAADGFRRFEVRPSEAGNAGRGELTVEVSSANSFHQTFCLAGTVRQGTRDGEP